MTQIMNGQQAQNDIAYNLHPFTNAKRHKEVGPLVVERGDGVYVYDINGKRYLEGMSGLWSVAVGFSESRLVDAAIRQMQKLPFYHNFAHKSHGPQIDLAEKLVTMAPVPMSKAFFTNSGSEANDTAIKLIWYRSNALGQPLRKKIIARDRGYHGGTIASASLTGLSACHKSFDLPLAGFLHTGAPDYWKDAVQGETEEQFASRRAAELEQLILREGPETIAAFFAEPVMGAGGVVIPPIGYWEKIQAVLNKYDILLVADEVICGFGRTGKMFGSETFNMRPDIMVLSKALASSYQPIAALLINDRIFQSIEDESNSIGTLGHGFTAGGHPVAAAVALENIRIIEEDGLVENAQMMGKQLIKELKETSANPLIGEVRGVGLMAGVALATNGFTKLASAAPGYLGGLVALEMQNRGVIVRNAYDTIVFCPPLIINSQQVTIIAEAFKEAIGSVAALLEK